MAFRQSFKTLLLAGGLAATLVSCKKDKDDDDTGTPAALHIKEYQNGEDFARFRYNAAGKVDQVTIAPDPGSGEPPLVYAVTYAGGKVDKLTNGEQEFRAVYENGKLDRVDIYVGEDKTFFTNYDYTGDALTRATSYALEGDDFMLFRQFDFAVNAAGNITETVALVNMGEPNLLRRSGHVEFQYDQKPNPLFEHRDLLAMLWQGVSKNNPTREDHFDAQLDPEDRFVYAYTYNAQGFPISAVVTQGLPGQPVVNSNLTITYQ